MHFPISIHVGHRGSRPLQSDHQQGLACCTADQMSSRPINICRVWVIVVGWSLDEIWRGHEQRVRDGISHSEKDGEWRWSGIDESQRSTIDMCFVEHRVNRRSFSVATLSTQRFCHHVAYVLGLGYIHKSLFYWVSTTSVFLIYLRFEWKNALEYVNVCECVWKA